MTIMSSACFPQTVILRNIPNNCSKSKLLDTVCAAGFSGTFDSFHMPLDQDTGANKGYAFFNFKTSSSAQVFKFDFHGKRLPGFNSRKVLVVELARVQSSAQQQFPPVINRQDKPVLHPSLIPAKVSVSTLSAIPRCLDKLEGQRPNLLTSSPVKVLLSKLASEQLIFASSLSMLSNSKHDDKERTPSISESNGASDDETAPVDKIQMQPEMPLQIYSIRL
jgi:hypothetical protein